MDLQLNFSATALTAAINDVQEKVDAALRNNQLLKPTVQTWLTRAAAAQAEATQLKDKAAAAEINSSSWIKGWYTCCSRSRSRSRSNILSSEIGNLLDERRTLFSTNNNPYFEEYRVYIDFPSRKASAERVMVALKNDEIRLVGLYGMAGVGKTMLVQALSQQAKDELLFDEVVLVSLSSQNQDLRTIQDNVAMQLDLMLEENENVAMQLDLMLEENESDISRAEHISQRLFQHTNVLVVLDNLCERVELAKVGIPLGCCKVVFTTRDQNVCDEMETDEKIQVVVLSDEDSWTLFRQNAGPKLESSDFQAAAIDIINKCKGFPLAIVTLGITLRRISNEDWADALVQLRKWNHAGMGSITSSIRLSFRWLRNISRFQYVNYVFLFCCLFAQDFKIEIEVLLWYLMGENVFGYGYPLGKARSVLDDAIGVLVSSPLLLYDKEDNKHVWMNDVVRDAAISIAYNYRFIVKDGMALIACTDMELRECQRLFVNGTKIRCGLPNQIIAPKLLTLSLNGYNDLNEIPPDFFSEMPRLKVLDLSNTDIESLPRSLPGLGCLRTLLMKNCRKLKDVSLIEKLEDLEILDLSGSNIQRLPKVRMANLTWFHV